MDIEDFFINDDDNHQKTLLDEAKIKVLDFIANLVQDMKSNIDFGENSNYINNSSTLNRQLGILNELNSINEEEVWDEELEDVIENAFKGSTLLTFNNLNDVLGENDSSIEIEDEEDNDDGSSLDF